MAGHRGVQGAELVAPRARIPAIQRWATLLLLGVFLTQWVRESFQSEGHMDLVELRSGKKVPGLI